MRRLPLLPCFATPLVAAALTLATAPVGAADKPKKEGSFGAAKAGGYLTKEQLRGCLSQQTRVTQQEAGLQQEKGALGAQKTELLGEGDALKVRLDALDRTNAEAVAAYNEQAKSRDDRVDQHQARAGVFNERVEAHQLQREAFAKDCSNRRFFEEDEIAIKQGG